MTFFYNPSFFTAPTFASIQKTKGMTVQSLTPNLGVNDVNATVEYYKKLGFELRQSVPAEGKLDWAMISAGGAALMFQEEASLKAEYPELQDRSVGGDLTFYVSVSDALALYERLKDSVTIVKQPHKTFYGADEFAIRDLNGYILTIAQSTN